MGNLLARTLRGRQPERSITTLEDYVAALNQFIYQGNTYPLTGIQQSMSGETTERIGNSLESYGQSAYMANGVVFACMAVRQLVFSAVRFQFQRFNQGRPTELWGDGSLSLLEQPWPGGTTQDLLARMIQDADLAGNFYAFIDTPLVRLGANDGAELVRLRPDWVEIALEARNVDGAQAGFRRLGYLYWEGGRWSGVDPAIFPVGEVAHFAPYPNPLGIGIGESWLTPVIREIRNDGLMMRHKQKFFENAATPNLVIRMDPAITLDAFLKFKTQMDAGHKGVENAYKSLYVAGAADVTVAGADFQQMDFKTVQGAGETRIAAAARVPPVIVGLSEGLGGSALNAGNYGMARRNLADGCMHPLWANAAGSLRRIMQIPAGSRLWYDARDVPFLREDEKDAAEIVFTQAQTMRQWIEAGYEADSVTACMVADGDIRLLKHTGNVSVQLQPAGAAGELTTGSADADAA